MTESLLPTATGAYEQRAPVASLREQFSSTWFNTLPDNGSPIAVVPDGYIDLQWIDGELRVAGPDREVNCESLRPGATVIGFRFRPGAASSWLRVSASELVGARVPLDIYWGPEARSIADRAGRGANPDAIARRLEGVLARRAERIRAPDPVASYIRQVLEVAPASGNDVVRKLCSKLNVSERTLRRRCHEDFGYGPKMLHRIVRFQRFLDLAGQRKPGVAGLATEAGYADQAHLTREARRMAAMTPATIREQLAR